MGTNTTGPRKPASLPTDDVLEELYEAAQRSDFETTSIPTRALEGLLADLIGRRFRDRCAPKPPKPSPKLETRLDYAIDGQLAFSLVIHEAGEGAPSYDAQRYLEAVCRNTSTKRKTQADVLKKLWPYQEPPRIVAGEQRLHPGTFNVTFRGAEGNVLLDAIPPGDPMPLGIEHFEIRMQGLQGSICPTAPPHHSTEPGLLWVDAYAPVHLAKQWRRQRFACECGEMIHAVVQERRIIAAKHEAPCDRWRLFMHAYAFDQGLRTDAEHAAEGKRFLANGVLSWIENNKGKLP